MTEDPASEKSPAEPAASEASADGLTKAAEETAGDAKALTSDGKSQAPRKKRDIPTWLWVLGIALVFLAELVIYGHNGRIQVCVGLEGFTDFALVGDVRTPENARAFPFCSERLNLGMYGASEEAGRVALSEACTRASALMGGDRLECLRRENKWTRKVNKEQIMPWDPRLYRRLLWLD